MSSFTGKARRSALHRSSLASLRQTSGPLQNGQTRISSSLGSIGAPAGVGQPGEEEIVEIGRKDRVDAQVPHPSVGECGAFYGILLRHDDDLGARKLELGGAVGVMVGKGDAPRLHSQALEVVEKALRVADAGDGDHRAAANREREFLRACLLVARERVKAPPAEAHRELARRGNLVGMPAVHHRRVDAAQPRNRLAQRAGGQQKPVAETPLADDHRELDISRERIVLQAVVAHQHVHFGVRLEERARGGRAIGRDIDGNARAPRDDYRLVADMLWRGRVGGHPHPPEATAVASRALSITFTTGWWVAAASALIATTGSFAPLAASFSAAAKFCVLPNGVCVPLIAYLPVESTATLSICGRSDGRSAAASGRLICSSANRLYVVVRKRKIRMTMRMSISGIRLISGSSRARPPRKFMPAAHRG